MLSIYNLQSDGGYKSLFVTNPPSGCLCLFCHYPARHAYQHSCGKITCKTCLDKYKKGNALKLCPSCNIAFRDSNTVKDVRTDNEVNDLLVKCSNKEKSCQWHGELKYINNHLDKCPYHTVLCTKNCGAKMLRQSLEIHLAKQCPKRSHTCPHCNLIGEYQTVTGNDHLHNCPGMKTICTICKKTVQRVLIDMHQKICKLEPVPCQYRSVGCTAQPRRQDIPQHNLEAMSDHLQLAVQAIAQQSTAIVQQSNEIAQLKRDQQEVNKTILFNGKPNIVNGKANVNNSEDGKRVQISDRKSSQRKDLVQQQFLHQLLNGVHCLFASRHQWNWGR